MNPESPLGGHKTDWTTAQSGASLAFGLLGRMLHSYPEQDWLRPILEQDLFDETPFAAEQAETQRGLELLQSWTSEQHGRLSGDSLDNLQSDYTRLFIGPGTVLAPPWESVHLSVDRLLFQEQTLKVRGWYERYGLEVSNQYQEPDDHVGLELGFLSHLAGLAASSLERQDQAAFEEVLKAEREFTSEHLARWVPLWCEIVILRAQTDFYRGLAHLVRGALYEIAAQLEIEVPSWTIDDVQEI